MNTTDSQSDSNQRIDHVLSTLSKYRTLWIAPAILGMVLSIVYVVALRSETWSAKQSLIVRDDLLGQSFKPGRFDSIESMKSAQETILEISRKPQVIHNALEQLGPESKPWFGMRNKGWPSEETIEQVQGSITFNAPNGAEFGKTEVIVLNTKASTRDRSRKFIELLLDEIIVKVDEVRSLRLQSMESELIQARDAAMAALAESKSRLQAMDANLGSDFGSMSSLVDSQSSDNPIKRDISQIRLEKRATEQELESLKITLSQVVSAKENPQRIFTTSAALIKSLPALDDLKKALIKTQGELAVIAGQYEPAHPSYRKAKNSIEAMKQQMFLELDSSIAGLQEDITLSENRIERLNQEMADLDERLASLGSKRADLMTLVAEVNQRAEIANNAQSDLSEIQGLAQAKNAELITRVDEPQVSTRPDGLGKKAIVLACGFGGLMLGLGLVMLIAPTLGPDQGPNSAGRPGSNSGTAPNHAFETFFDSSTFEKIIVSAATAATTAMQSAVKARQFFMPPRAESGDSLERESQEKPATASRDILRSETPVQPDSKNGNSVETETVSQTPARQPVSKAPPGTPSVDDLLEAANVIANPAPVASKPLSSPPRRAKIQPAEVKPTPAEAKPALSKFAERPIQPVPQAESVSPIGQMPAGNPSIREATAKSVSELAAVQLAALRGTQVQRSGSTPTSSPTSPQPKKAEPQDVKNRSKSLPATGSPTPTPATRVEPQTIMLSKMPPRDSRSSDSNTSNPESVANLTRRGPNVRPVDLIRSADDEDSTFVRINLSGIESKPKSNSPGSTQSAGIPSANTQNANPFLKDRSPNLTHGGQTSEDPDDAGSIPIPEQIRKLSDSIAKFANPANLKNREP